MTWWLLGLLGCGLGVSPDPIEGVGSTQMDASALREQAAERPIKPPTEHWLHEDAEMSNKAGRKQWVKERHRAAPDVDWKAIERQNGLNQIAKRNALASQRTATPIGGEWTERGSENLAGRMMVAALSEDGSELYAGSALGGVWRGSPEGANWEPLGDNLFGGAHWLTLHPQNNPNAPERMLVATDWGSVHISEDDGQSWTVPTGVPDLWGVRRLLKASDDSGITFMVVQLAYQNEWRLLRSDDDARSFDEIESLGGFAGDVWMPRDGGSDLYLLDEGGVLRVSTDYGDTWEDRGTVVDATEGELTGSEAGAPRLWVGARVGSEDRLFRSDDAGMSFTDLQAMDDYWSVLVASIVDVDRVAWGGVEVHISRNGGDDFDIVNAWGDYYQDPQIYLHADIMGMDVFPEDGGEVWYLGTDGGLYESHDGLDSVNNLSMTGLRVSQYYDTLTDRTNPDNIAAGSQDQGYQLTNGIAQTADRLDFWQTISGDYAHLVSTDRSHDWVFSVYPGFMLVQEDVGPDRLYFVDFPPDPGFAWLPPLVPSNDRKRNVFFLGQQIWEYDWEPSIGDWTVDTFSDHDFSLGAPGYAYLTGLDFSEVDPSVAVAVNNVGVLFHSEDGGVTWDTSNSDGPGSQWLYGTAILTSSLDADVAWVGGSGYSNPPVYRTENGGRTWKKWSEGLPDTLVYCLCEAPDGSGILFAGTETGAYRRDPGASEWVDITGNQAPVTIYWSCEALDNENTIRFGTYGRGIWDYSVDPLGEGCFPPVDRDGDGADCDVDCDDDDPTLHPGADEIPCDGIDQNCDPTDNDACVVPPTGSTSAVETPKKGCGCTSGGPMSGALAGWLAVLLVARRRR